MWTYALFKLRQKQPQQLRQPQQPQQRQQPILEGVGLEVLEVLEENAAHIENPPFSGSTFWGYLSCSAGDGRHFVLCGAFVAGSDKRRRLSMHTHGDFPRVGVGLSHTGCVHGPTSPGWCTVRFPRLVARHSGCMDTQM